MLFLPFFFLYSEVRLAVSSAVSPSYADILTHRSTLEWLTIREDTKNMSGGQREPSHDDTEWESVTEGVGFVHGGRQERVIISVFGMARGRERKHLVMSISDPQL